MSFAEMFSGIGGFRLGLERSGWRCVWANDNDKYACQVYRNRFGGGELVEGDIREVDVKRIPDHTLLTAGFPCQAFSVAGKRKGTGEAHGTLFWQICRVARVKRPALLLLENVKGILSSDSGRTFAVILRLLEELGYLIEWQVLNSKHFGVPQNRERVFLVGHLREASGRQIFPIGECNKMDVGKDEQKISLFHNSGAEIQRIYNPSGLAPTLHGKTGGWQEPKIIDVYNKTVNRVYHASIQRNPTPKIIHENLSGNIALHDEAVALRSDASHNYQTLVTPKNANAVRDRWLMPMNQYGIRRLTPVECERLQGFPDGWTEGVSDTQRYKLLGNAVTVNVVEFLGRKLKEATIRERCG